MDGAGDVRLVGGESAADGGAQYGRLEIFDGSVWGGVCDTTIDLEFLLRFSPRTFTDGSAVVACRQLGFADGIVAAFSVRAHPSRFPPPSYLCSPDLLPDYAYRSGDLHNGDMETRTWSITTSSSTLPTSSSTKTLPWYFIHTSSPPEQLPQALYPLPRRPRRPCSTNASFHFFVAPGCP